MTQARARLAALSDEKLPALPAMLGPDAFALLQTAIGPAGGRLVAARPQQVHWRPGHSLTVVYATRVAWPGRSAGCEPLVATTGSDLPDGAALLACADQADQQVAVWSVLNDPGLPGLALALDPGRARRLLDELDVPPGAVATRLRSYRPGRRAVVELTAGRRRLFVKVVPPREAPYLQALHRGLSERLPVPRSHGWSGEHGVIVLEAMPGRTLREALAHPTVPLPDPRELAGLLDRLAVPQDGPTGPGFLASAGGHARLIARLLPGLRPRLDALVAALSEAEDRGPPVAVHGDFHEAQLVVNGGRITGLLDVDTVGLGRRLDDWACLIGHLAVRMEAAPPAGRRRVQAYGKGLLALADSQAGPPGLRRSAAAVILGLATGPFRVQTPAWPAETGQRVALAERWLESATKVSRRKRAVSVKSALTPALGPIHVEVRD
jgi:hypothetical protein